MFNMYQERLHYLVRLHEGLIDTEDRLLTLDNARRYWERLRLQSEERAE